VVAGVVAGMVASTLWALATLRYAKKCPVSTMQELDALRGKDS